MTTLDHIFVALGVLIPFLNFVLLGWILWKIHR